MASEAPLPHSPAPLPLPAQMPGHLGIRDPKEHGAGPAGSTDWGHQMALKQSQKEGCLEHYIPVSQECSQQVRNSSLGDLRSL